MGAGMYNTGALIAQTIFGINRVQVIAAAAVGALFVGLFARCPRPRFPRCNHSGPVHDRRARDHVDVHVTKHEPRLPGFAQVCFAIPSPVVVI